VGALEGVDRIRSVGPALVRSLAGDADLVLEGARQRGGGLDEDDTRGGVGMALGVGGSDEPTEGMAHDLPALEAQVSAQRLDVAKGGLEPKL